MNTISIERTVDVSADRRISLDVPEHVPCGEVRIFVRFEPKPVSPRKFEPTPDDIDEFYGCFKGKGVWEGDSVALIRKMRDEW
jgi:hypothetical protein